MMDMNTRYEQRMQHYRLLLRKAEEQRLVKGSGVTAAGTLRSIASGVWNQLSQILFSVVTSRSNSVTVRENTVPSFTNVGNP